MTYMYQWNRDIHGGWDLSATSIDNPDESVWTRVHIFSHGMYYIYSGPGVVSSWGKLKGMNNVHDLKARLLAQVLDADAHSRVLHRTEPIKAKVPHPLDQLFDSYVGQVVSNERG